MRCELVFSLGNACACSQAIRRAGLQFASYPFDWTAGSTLDVRARLIEDGFADWLDQDALELTDVRGAPHYARIYRNRKTGITFSHDFPVDDISKAAYDAIASKYARRIQRLYDDMRRATRILGVYAEVPYRAAESDKALLDAQRRIQRACPGGEFHLLYFSQSDGDRSPVVSALSDRVTRVAVDYRASSDPASDHVVDGRFIVDYLKSNVQVEDVRSEADKARYREAVYNRQKSMWGEGLTRCINRRLYKAYRSLERLLAERGVIPSPRRPLNLYGKSWGD